VLVRRGPKRAGALKAGALGSGRPSRGSIPDRQGEYSATGRVVNKIIIHRALWFERRSNEWTVPPVTLGRFIGGGEAN